MIKKNNFYVNCLILLIILDIITTLICIIFGGVEYNPISLFFINQSYFLFALIKILMIIGIYILNNYTIVFNGKIIKIFLIIINMIFLIVVLLNILYIIIKLTGMI
jgi:hypothetical protein